MKNKKYWQKRFEILEENLLSKGENLASKFQNKYNETSENIQKEIESFYQRFAVNNKISYNEAKRILTTSERKKFQMTLDDYIQKGKELELNPQWIHEMENASTVYRLSRLETLQTGIRQQVEMLEHFKDNSLFKTANDIFENSYYKTLYEIQKETGLTDFEVLNKRKIEKVLVEPWTPDGSNFSDKIWKDKNALLYNLNTTFTHGMIRGESYQKNASQIAKIMDTSYKSARRLVLTESAFFASRASEEAFKELKVKKYIFSATLDLKTSEKCRELDGKVFEMKDCKIGVTSPPLHLHCRSTKIPYIDEEFIQNNERLALDENGNRIKVQASMTYKQWYEKYVKNNPGMLAEEKKVKNKANDKKQFERYKGLLKQNSIKRFADFQELKYNNINYWNEFKTQFRQEKLKADLSSQLLSLTDKEIEAVRAYSGFNGYRINNAIIKGIANSKTAEYIKYLDSAIEKGVITENITVYRKTIPEYLNAFPKDMKITKNKIQNLVGKSLNNDIFISTSLNDIDLQGRNVHMKINVPKGYKGALYIKDIVDPKHKYQEEILFKRGMEYKINDIKIEDEIYFIDAEVI